MSTDTNVNRDPAVTEQEEAEAARQEVLERLGALGTYVAPSMTVLVSSKVTAATITSGTTN